VAIPPEIRADAEIALAEFCTQLSSADVAEAQRYAYEFAANSAVLVQQRPSFMNPAEWASTPVAKFRYSETRNIWSLYWSDKSGRWHRLSDVPTTKDLRVLLQTVVKDPAGVFWG
jgi:hypothetical protein